MSDEFYIGWEDRMPAGHRRTVRHVVIWLGLSALVLGSLLAYVQRTIGTSVFEWGQLKEFSGVLRAAPFPHLLVPRPHARTNSQSQASTAFSSYPLVAPFKFGFDAETAQRMDGQTVVLQGTLIHRGDQTMIEVAPGTIRGRERLAAAPAALPGVVALGRQTLRGEIVDSKCWLGVMNPGALLPHRACAIRCISGGVPPILLVRQRDGAARHYLIVSADGQPMNQALLEFVAEPVEIQGEVERQGDLLILRAKRESIRRLGP